MFETIPYLCVDLPESVKCYKYAGMFDDEIIMIEKLMQQPLPEPMRKRLAFELVIAEGMKRDYSITMERALEIMRGYIHDFTADELQKIMDEGYADWRLVNGEVRLQDSFYWSVTGSCPYVIDRRLAQEGLPPRSPVSELLDNTIAKLSEKGRLRYFYRIKAWIAPVEACQEEGKRIHVHLPIPLVTNEQKEVTILHASPEARYSDGVQRTAYFDTLYQKGQKFTVEYSYQNTAYYKKLDPSMVSDLQPDFYTGEESPHILFTPYIRMLAEKIAGSETNPLLIARRIYDYITTHVKYSLMREYQLLENISEYCAVNLRGDCGVQALLFITLCRYMKIPAKWQSGFSLNPNTLSAGPHDWAQFYIAPYGWLFADPSYGGSAYRNGAEERRKFYFGNIDPFRMAANSEFQRPFDPKKQFVRIDPYDNQSGEIEYDDRGLNCDEVQFGRELLEAVELQ